MRNQAKNLFGKITEISSNDPDHLDASKESGFKCLNTVRNIIKKERQVKQKSAQKQFPKSLMKMDVKIQCNL